MSFSKHHPNRAPDHEATPLRDGFEILDTAHAEALTALDRLTELVERLREGGPDATLRQNAAQISRFFTAYAIEHHLDEEKHVFPRLLEEGDAETVHAVQSLLQDHRWLDEDWREVGAQVDAVAGGQGWVDLDQLAEGVRIFCGLMRAHIHFEETFLYPRARAGLNERLRAEMSREMAARRRTIRRLTREVISAEQTIGAPVLHVTRH